MTWEKLSQPVFQQAQHRARVLGVRPTGSFVTVERHTASCAQEADWTPVLHVTLPCLSLSPYTSFALATMISSTSLIGCLMSLVRSLEIVPEAVRPRTIAAGCLWSWQAPNFFSMVSVLILILLSSDVRCRAHFRGGSSGCRHPVCAY